MTSIGAAGASHLLPFEQAVPERSGTERAISRVAQDFESVFTSMMIKEMRKTLESGGLFGEDPGDVYGGLFDQFIGQQMSAGGGLGMSRMIQQALEREQNAMDRQKNLLAETPGDEVRLSTSS